MAWWICEECACRSNVAFWLSGLLMPLLLFRQFFFSDIFVMPNFPLSLERTDTTFRLLQKIADFICLWLKLNWNWIKRQKSFGFCLFVCFYSVTWNLPFTCTKDALIGFRLVAEEYLEQLWKRGNFSFKLSGWSTKLYCLGRTLS